MDPARKGKLSLELVEVYVAIWVHRDSWEGGRLDAVLDAIE
jgi:hypothetical protein